MRLIYYLLIGLLAACQGNSSSSTFGGSGLSPEIEPLYEEIISIHDEVMPEMTRLTQLQTRITDLLKTQRSETPVNTEKLKETNRILGQLNRAESAMWDWMDNFGKLDSIPADQKEGFLNGEKLSAENMRDLVMNSIKSASTYLEENSVTTNDEN